MKVFCRFDLRAIALVEVQDYDKLDGLTLHLGNSSDRQLSQVSEEKNQFSSNCKTTKDFSLFTLK